MSTNAFGFEFPASWLQSLTPFYVILLAPVFAKLWVRLGARQPSSPTKFALGLLAIGLAFCLLVPASALTASGKISPLWLVGVYLLDVIGELCLSPVGLSTVTRLSPARFVGLMMGLWFFATSLGNKLAGTSPASSSPTTLTAWCSCTAASPSRSWPRPCCSSC